MGSSSACGKSRPLNLRLMADRLSGQRWPTALLFGMTVDQSVTGTTVTSLCNDCIDYQCPHIKVSLPTSSTAVRMR